MPERLRRALPAVIALAVFIAALEVLRVELRSVSWPGLVADVLAVPPWRLATAAALTVLNYTVLTGYDLMAVRYAGTTFPAARVMFVSFIAFAVSNSVGLATLTGASIRYRFYSRWNVTAQELSRIIFSYSVTFWLGLLALGGMSLTFLPVHHTDALAAAHVLRSAAGSLLLAAPLAYVAAAALRRGALRIWRFELPIPTARFAAAQLSVSLTDWLLAGTIPFVLLPEGAVPFVTFLAAFLASVLTGLASHVPGGIGVFEGLMVIILAPYIDSGELLPALLVYRVIYYVIPLAVAIVALVTEEAARRRPAAARVTAALDRAAQQLTPRLLAGATFAAGAVLLFSGTTPAAAGRLARLDRMLPLGVIETSHFLGSVAGAGLLVLSHGLARRLDGAYYLTELLLGAGITASLFKGGDYEEAALLLAVLVMLRRARYRFDRRAAFFETRFSARWVALVAGALGASVWLGLFAFKHVDYSHQLWWQFELHAEASRSLRASVGAAILLAIVALVRLLGPAPHEASTPGEADLQDAGRIIAAQPATSPNLLFLRDKAVMFDEAREAFVMYGVQGRTWVALGDPVGPDAVLTEMVRRFLERCDDYAGVPVFYQVSPLRLHAYADFGMAFLKLGEAARVDLASLTLEGARGARHRQAVRALQKVGGAFRVIAPPAVREVLPELRRVSDDWLAQRSGAEKGFSLGFFEDDYMARFPVAIIERNGRIDAFANVWPGARRQEISPDLMRYCHEAPKGVMEMLMVHLQLWAREQGYRWFDLGMAPLSGFEQSPVAPVWNRLGAFLYEHGEAVYNFQGLRAYKEKFNPIWEPRYLAYPGALRLPRILADVSALIAGGYRRIFIK